MLSELCARRLTPAALLVLLLLPGCSGSSSGSTTTSTPTVSGSVTGASTSYSVMLLDSDGNTTIADIGGSGFSTTVTNGSYSVALLDADSRPVGLLVQNDASVFVLDSNTDLGTMTWDSGTSVITSTATLTPSSLVASAGGSIDLGDMSSVTPSKYANPSNGVTVTNVLENGQADSDGDKVPDFLDNDSNENGTYDTLEGLDLHKVVVHPAAGENVTTSTIESVGCTLFDNLKLSGTELFDSMGTPLAHDDRHVLTFHMSLPSGLESLVTGVAVTKLPAFADGNVAPASGSFTFTGYPMTGSAWSAVSHALIPGVDSMTSQTAYCIFVTPSAVPVPSVFQLTLSLSTGTTAVFTPRLAFVFNTPPKVTSIDDGTTNTAISYPLTEGDPGTQTNPLTISSSTTTLTLTADRPLNKLGGVEICGMRYQAHIFYRDGTSTQIGGAMTPLLTDSAPCTTSNDLVLPIDATTYLPTTYSGMAVSSFQIDFTVVAPNGDNSAEILYVKY